MKKKISKNIVFVYFLSEFFLNNKIYLQIKILLKSCFILVIAVKYLKIYSNLLFKKKKHIHKPSILSVKFEISMKTNTI
jgi:hypothetical protein